MKTIFQTKKIVILFLALSVGFGAMADENKTKKEIRARLEMILNSGDIEIIKVEFNQMIDNLRLLLTVDEPVCLESWMLDEEYLSQPKVIVEPWMSDVSYLN